jgi:hypothetical protein
MFGVDKQWPQGLVFLIMFVFISSHCFGKLKQKREGNHETRHNVCGFVAIFAPSEPPTVKRFYMNTISSSPQATFIFLLNEVRKRPPVCLASISSDFFLLTLCPTVIPQAAAFSSFDTIQFTSYLLVNTNTTQTHLLG